MDGRSGRRREGVCTAAGRTLKTDELAANEVQRVGGVTRFSVLINEAGRLRGWQAARREGTPRCPLQK